jgi:hypothetical protein
MRKRLLMQMLAVVCAMGAYAANVGDYLYTSTAKYKVTGTNSFVNGVFGTGFGTEWTNGKGGEPGELWGIETGKGPNAENVVISKGAANGEGLADTLAYVMPLETGVYTISYYAKVETAFLSNTKGTTNCLNIFLDDTGSVTDTTGYVGIAANAALTTEWQQVVYSFQVVGSKFLCINISGMATNAQFTGFEIYPVTEVYDTRIAERELAYMTKLYNEPDFNRDSESKEGLGAVIAAFQEVLATPTAESESAGTWEGLFEASTEVIAAYLDANAGNTVGTTVDGMSTPRYLSDWAGSGWGYSQWNSYNNANRGTWRTIGGRWGFSPNDGSLERPENDGYVFSAGIQVGANYTLDCGMAVVDTIFKGTSLTPGKYMFSIEAQAVAARYSSNSDISTYGYGSNDGIKIAGPWMWIGTDTLAFKPATEEEQLNHPTWRFADSETVLNGQNWQRLYVIGEIKEGENITGGFHFPVVSATGGRYSLRNPEFRAVGKTQAEIDHLYAYDQLKSLRETLFTRLENANNDNAKTIDDGYPWGHKELTDSITKYQAIYDDLLTVVDAEGVEKDPTRVTLEYKDEIAKAITYMNQARTNFANVNKGYQTLKADVASCNETYADEKYAGATASEKSTFKTVIDASQAMVDATTSTSQYDQFMHQDTLLLTARQDYMMIPATYANPTDLKFTLPNGGFEAWGTSEPNYTSTRTINGWTFWEGPDFKQWQIRNNDAYESGKCANVWRGSIAGPNGKASQTFKLTRPGVYMYRAKAYATDDTWSQYVNIATVLQNLDMITFASETANDTIYNPAIKLFFGKDGATNDSLRLAKCSPEVTASKAYTRYTPLNYAIIYSKSDSNAENFELGFEANGNGAAKGANGFGFGDNHLYYLGEEAAAKAAIQAAYNTEAANALACIAKYKDVELKYFEESLRMYMINMMYRYMGDLEHHQVMSDDGGFFKVPTTMQEQMNAILTLQECQALLADICSYEPAPEEDTSIDALKYNDDIKKAVANGIYTLTGVRIQGDVKSLPRGLYIINGKKIAIK